jgi:nucleoid-associated protein YgaU
MGLFNFIGDVGKKIFGSDADDTSKTTHIHDEINELALPVQISVAVDGDAVTLEGNAADQASKEKAILAVGNLDGISSVNDKIIVADHDNNTPSEQATFVTVQKGDTLWKISQNHYGDGNNYHKIFEANQPMLKSADAIFVGQILRIPA